MYSSLLDLSLLVVRIAHSWAAAAAAGPYSGRRLAANLVVVVEGWGREPHAAAERIVGPAFGPYEEHRRLVAVSSTVGDEQPFRPS